MGHLLIVQHVAVHWTKASRGGVGARRRSAVPNAFRLPDRDRAGELPAGILHRVRCLERTGYVPEEALTRLESASEVEIGPVIIQAANDRLQVAFTYSFAVGAPERWATTRRLEAAPGEWLQVLYNGRHGEERGWRYERHVVNVGLFDAPDEGVFLHTQPTRRCSALALLR